MRIIHTLPVLVLSACGVLPPTQEMSDARQTLQAAENGGAIRYAPYSIYHARNHLEEAQRQLQKGRHTYSYAGFHALAAKHAALRAHRITMAYHDVENRLQQAGKNGCLWLGTPALFAKIQNPPTEDPEHYIIERLAATYDELNLAARQCEEEQIRLNMQPVLPAARNLSISQIHALREYRKSIVNTEEWLNSFGLGNAPPVYEY